jgi:hypothetical protein
VKAPAVGLLALCAAALAALAGRRGGSSSPGGQPPADDVEPYATREELSRQCVAVAPRPGVEAFRRWVLETRGGRDGGIWRECSIGGHSEHKEGRAWDWMCTLPQGRELVARLLANGDELARRAGVLYLIHDHRIWRAYEPRGWSAHTGNPHTDHVHLSFSTAGAMGRTSFYTRGDAAPYLQGVA